KRLPESEATYVQQPLASVTRDRDRLVISLERNQHVAEGLRSAAANRADRVAANTEPLEGLLHVLRCDRQRVSERVRLPRVRHARIMPALASYCEPTNAP